MSKTITHGKDARDAIMRGVDFLADAVKITEGPRGRNIILGQRALGQSPKVTRDGVTVCNYVDAAEPTEQLGTDLVREAAQKTDNAVGDGTTASIVLAQALIRSGFQFINDGANPMAIERGIHKSVDAITKRLRSMAIDVTPEKIFQVATVSAHGDTIIGQLVADAVQKAGRDGVVTAEPSSTSDTYVESVAGLELEKSNLIHPAFITHPEQMSCELLDCRILLWEGVIATAKSLVSILSQLQIPGSAPLLIIAGGYEQEALSVLITNKIQKRLPLNVVRMEAYGDRRREVMRDIAALIGGKAYTEDMGLKIENVKLESLGVARKVVTNMAKTQIIEGKGNQEELAGRINLIRKTMETVDPGTKSILKKRLAALLGGITLIKVGGVTVTEMEEKRDRVVDAMSAAKAAIDAGIVPGGGTALLQASSALSTLHLSAEEYVGLEVVHEACRAIARQIADNAGITRLDVHLAQLMASTRGYNALTGEFQDLVESGIIDPVNVVITSLANAAAVACSILTMGATVAEVFTERHNNG